MAAVRDLNPAALSAMMSEEIREAVVGTAGLAVGELQWRLDRSPSLSVVLKRILAFAWLAK